MKPCPPTRRAALRAAAGCAAFAAVGCTAVAAVGCAAFAAVATPAWPQDRKAQAAAFIHEAGQELAAVVGGAQSLEDKRRRLLPFIERVVDVDAVARFCLGRYWKMATADEQRAYLDLFHGVLLRNVVARMGDYQHTEVHVEIGQPDMREDGVHVPTVVQRTGNPPARVTWLVQDDAGSPRIVDVIAEGTSLRLTVRSDFNAFLARHNDSIPALLEALRQQANQSSG